MKLIAAPLTALLALGFGAFLAAPASAHTPDISASCSGVHVGATAYDAGLANKWSVTINGVTQSGTFGASFDQTFPVPQEGATTTWSAFVEAADGSYHGASSGEVGPCGAPTDACAELPGTQPVGTACTPPHDVTRTDSRQLAGCTVAFAGKEYGAGRLTYDEQYDDTYSFNETTNTWDLVVDEEPTIANVSFTAWSTAQQVRHGCVRDQHPGVHPGHTSTGVADEVASSDSPTSVSPTSVGATSAVPTSVDAGLASAPTQVTLAPASAPADQQRNAAVVVLLAAAACLMGAWRLRRS